MQAISRSPLPRHTGFFGGHSEEVPPVPIPNTEVKLFSADGTAWETMWESRSPPNSLKKPLRAHALRGFSFFLLYPSSLRLFPPYRHLCLTASIIQTIPPCSSNARFYFPERCNRFITLFILSSIPCVRSILVPSFIVVVILGAPI